MNPSPERPVGVPRRRADRAVISYRSDSGVHFGVPVATRFETKSQLKVSESMTRTLVETRRAYQGRRTNRFTWAKAASSIRQNPVEVSAVSCVRTDTQRAVIFAGPSRASTDPAGPAPVHRQLRSA